MTEIEEKVGQATTEGEDSPDAIMAEIKRLKAKLKTAELEGEEDVPKVKLPLADVHIKIAPGQSVWRKLVTPPELLVLLAIHRAGSGGDPLQDLVLAKQVREKLEAQSAAEKNKERKAWLKELANEIPDHIEVDPRGLKAALQGRYGADKIEKCFPGAEPRLPETFRRVISRSGEVNIKAEGLFQMQAFGGDN
jgi:hypothetical protein